MTDIIELPDFSKMPIAKLREYASHMRIPLNKDAEKKEIVDQILARVRGRATPVIADTTSTLKPGYARIRLQEDPTPGASNLPAYINENGYVATIPRGIPLVVPMRVVRNLNNATVTRKQQTNVTDQHGRTMFKDVDVKVPSYPFQVLDSNPGPEPRTQLEMANFKRMAPKRRYRAIFGRWPKPGELARAIEKGLISLKEDDILDSNEEALVQKLQAE